jgi:hypothetical protein
MLGSTQLHASTLTCSEKENNHRAIKNKMALYPTATSWWPVNINTMGNLWFAMRLFSVSENKLLKCKCQFRYLHITINKQYKSCIEWDFSLQIFKIKWFKHTFATSYMMHNIIWSMCLLKKSVAWWLMIGWTREYIGSTICFEKLHFSETFDSNSCKFC